MSSQSKKGFGKPRIEDERRFTRSLQRKAEQGFQGYPLATVAFYGSDNELATKVAVGIVKKDQQVEAMQRWFSDDTDIRSDNAVFREVLSFIEKHRVKSVVMTEGIIGCPHEEAVDYPKGEFCPHCPYWANRARWTGEVIY